MQDYSKRRLGVRGPSPRGIFPRFTAAMPPSHLPSEVSYEDAFGPIFDQGDEPDCEAHALAGIFTLYFHKRTGKWFDFSRAAIYVQGKLQFENADFTDPGMYPATGLQLVEAKGNVFELVYPTTDLNVEKRVTIPDELWHDEFKIVTFTEVDPTPEAVMLALHSGGPIAMAVDWAKSWFTPDANGVLPPRDYSAGGHYIIGGAYAKSKPFLPNGGVKIRNSWGPGWGRAGWAWLPFEQLQTSAMNFYTIRVDG